MKPQRVQTSLSGSVALIERGSRSPPHIGQNAYGRSSWGCMYVRAAFRRRYSSGGPAMALATAVRRLAFYNHSDVHPQGRTHGAPGAAHARPADREVAAARAAAPETDRRHDRN